MKTLKINAKAAPEMEQILSKVNAGFKNIEIQLLHEIVSEDEYNDTKNAIEKYEIDISVVHTPLISEEGEVLLEEVSLIHLLKEKYFNIFDDTCKYAQYISDLEKKQNTGEAYNASVEDTTVNYFYAMYMLSRCESFISNCMCSGVNIVNSFNGDKFVRSEIMSEMK